MLSEKAAPPVIVNNVRSATTVCQASIGQKGGRDKALDSFRWHGLVSRTCRAETLGAFGVEKINVLPHGVSKAESSS